MNDNSDIDKIDNIQVLIDMCTKDAKEANELAKKLEKINERFNLIRDKITGLRHQYDNKSEEKEDIVDAELNEKPKKTKKPTKKELKKGELESAPAPVSDSAPPDAPQQPEQLEEIEVEEDTKNKNQIKKTTKKDETPVKKTTKRGKKKDEE